MGPNRLFRTERIEAISDGVIAVAITLMFLGFEQSYEAIREAKSSGEVWTYIGSLWPRFMGYCLSFLFIGGYWLKQHLIFHYVRRADRVFVGANLLFLMCIAMLPVATDWLIESVSHEFNAIIVFYGLSYSAVSLALLGIWSWASYNRRLVFPNIRDETVRSIRRQIIEGLLACLCGVAVSFFSIQFGLVILVGTALSSLWPRDSDGHWNECESSLSDSSVEEHPQVKPEPANRLPVYQNDALTPEVFASTRLPT